MKETSATSDPERTAHVLDRLYGMSEGEAGWAELVEALLGILEAGEDAPAESDLAWLAPHLARVLRQQAAMLEQANGPMAFQQQLLDEHPLAMGLYRRQGGRLWANARLRALLDASGCEEDLAGLLADKALPGKLSLMHEGRHVELLALSLPELGSDRVGLFGRSGEAPWLDGELLSLEYGLTQTESQVARHIAAGLGPDAIAAEHGTTLNTVRTQLKAVMAKTGTQRQNELAARLLLGPTTIRRHNGAGGAPLTGMAQHIVVRGRRLAYASYGAVSGPAVLFMHSWAGGRLQLPPAAMVGPDSAANHGFRIIAVDRPGCGLSALGSASASDPSEWALSMAELADRLGIARFAVLGYSLGAIHAIACARGLAERVKRVFLVSPVAPLYGLADLRGTLPTGRLLLALAMHMPALTGPLVRLWMARMRREPELYLDSVMPYLAPKDAVVMREPCLREHYLHSFVDAIQQGDEALMQELRLLVSRWDRELLPLTQPALIWHGQQDSHIAPALGQRLAELLGSARLQLLPEAGHYLLYHQWPLIAADIGAELRCAEMA